MELLTIRETADMLRVSQVTVRRYITSRRLPAVRVGKSIRIRREDAESLPAAVEPSVPELWAHKDGVFTEDDALWRLVGIGESEGPLDVSENKKKYLAEAYLPSAE